MPSHPTAYVSGSSAWRVVDSSLTGSNLMKPPRRLGGSMVWGKGKGRLSVSLTLGIALPCNALRGGWAPPSQPPPEKKKPHTKSHRVGKGMIPQRGTLGLPGLPGLTGVRRSAGRIRRSAGRGAEPPQAEPWGSWATPGPRRPKGAKGPPLGDHRGGSWVRALQAMQPPVRPMRPVRRASKASCNTIATNLVG